MARALWGGRFSAPPADVLKRFNDSFAFDRELFAEDVEGSVAWAAALGKAGALTASEVKKLTAGLKSISLADGPHEDVHSFVEAALYEKVGELAGKLHTGRSRNDQVATDLRLYLKKALVEAEGALVDLAEALVMRAEEEYASPMPGYTHLKRAEPVTFGHWCLAYVEMLLRDLDRLRSARERGDACPLGAGALSGTPIAVDREALAKSLGFARATANSLDSVSDRDLAADYLFAASLALSHLSRLAEDVIFFSADETGFVELPDALATGSSRMPHKKNPDVLELVRGHAGRSIGELTGLLALLKGLPLAYDKDLQLDKEPLFRTRQVLRTALPALTALMAGLKVNRDAMARAASDPRLLATELADALAKRSVPFRTAHEIVGRRIALGVTGTDADVTEDDLKALDVTRALGKRGALGGTSPRRVLAAARAVKKKVQKIRRQR